MSIKAAVKSTLQFCLNASSPLFRRISAMDASTAREKLASCSPRPTGTAEASNRLLPPRCDLQIVIPAYNVEKYLAACMDSVLAQETKYTYHVILIDDGSTDATPAIADRYTADSRVTVIHQENRGLSGARNTGIRELFGKYVMFVDSDDLLMPAAVEALLNTAFRFDCDLVEGGAYYVFDDRRTLMHRYPASELISSPLDVLHGHAWGKVYRAGLFESLRFPEGYWYEDSLLSYLIFPRLRRTGVSSEVVYGYRINPSGIVKASQGKPRAVDTFYITETLIAAHDRAGLPVDDAYLRYLLLQFRLNQFRLADLPGEIQESVFVLTCGLYERIFPEDWTDRRSRALLRALKRRDFGAFRMCCKLF